MKDERKEIDQNDLIELDFLERLALRLPQDDEVLKVLGDIYTRVGRFEKGLEIDHRLAALCPDDSMVWYNLGCSLALLEKRDEALKALSRAVTLGYEDHEWMIRDDDLRSLREERAFKTLIKRIAKGTPKVKHGHAGHS
jgi:tetratricopeptide (TPR) repeat protein